MKTSPPQLISLTYSVKLSKEFPPQIWAENNSIIKRLKNIPEVKDVYTDVLEEKLYITLYTKNVKEMSVQYRIGLWKDMLTIIENN